MATDDLEEEIKGLQAGEGRRKERGVAREKKKNQPG